MGDDWEEEEQLVVVELAGTVSNEFLTKNKNTCKILDIDSESPVVQVGQYVFSGEYEDALGSCVVFEEQPRKGKDSGPELKYLCHSVKKLLMQRVFLTERKEHEDGAGADDTEDEAENTTILLSDEDEEAGPLDEMQSPAHLEEGPPVEEPCVED